MIGNNVSCSFRDCNHFQEKIEKQSFTCLHKSVYKKLCEPRGVMKAIQYKLLGVLKQSEVECVVAIGCSLFLFVTRNSGHHFCSLESGKQEIIFEWLQVYSYTHIISVFFISAMSFIVCSRNTCSVFLLGSLSMLVVFSSVFYLCWYMNALFIVITSPLHCSLMVGSTDFEYLCFLGVVCYKTIFLLYVFAMCWH